MRLSGRVGRTRIDFGVGIPHNPHGWGEDLVCMRMGSLVEGMSFRRASERRGGTHAFGTVGCITDGRLGHTRTSSEGAMTMTFTEIMPEKLGLGWKSGYYCVVLLWKRLWDSGG